VTFSATNRSRAASSALVAVAKVRISWRHDRRPEYCADARLQTLLTDIRRRAPIMQQLHGFLPKEQLISGARPKGPQG
jgi:hypothetical protein